VKNKHPTLHQFEISPLSKAGVLIINMQNQQNQREHDISTPHRDKHYLLMLATHGRCKLNLDFEALTITAPAMLFIYPGQVHHVVEMNELQGWTISFDPSLIDNEVSARAGEGLQGPNAVRSANGVLSTSFYFAGSDRTNTVRHS
jgi:hypothetical protein